MKYGNWTPEPGAVVIVATGAWRCPDYHMATVKRVLKRTFTVCWDGSGQETTSKYSIEHGDVVGRAGMASMNNVFPATTENLAVMEAAQRDAVVKAKRQNILAGFSRLSVGALTDDEVNQVHSIMDKALARVLLSGLNDIRTALEGVAK